MSSPKVSTRRDEGYGWALTAALAATLIWSATPAVTLVAVSTIPPVTLGVLRTLFAALVVLPIALLLRLPWPRTPAGWLDLVLSSLLGFIAYPILVSIGITRTSTAHAGVIFAAAPIFTGLFSFMLTRAWPKSLWWLGALVAIGGQSVLVLGRAPTGAVNPASLEGDLWIMAATVVVSAGYVAGGRLAGRIGSWPGTVWSIFLAALMLIPFAATSQVAFDWHLVSAHSLAALAFLVILTVVLGYVLWYWALDQGGAAAIAPVQFLLPVFTTLIAVGILGESVDLPVVIAMAGVLAGVLICRRA